MAFHVLTRSFFFFWFEMKYIEYLPLTLFYLVCPTKMNAEILRHTLPEMLAPALTMC